MFEGCDCRVFDAGTLQFSNCFFSCVEEFFFFCQEAGLVTGSAWACYQRQQGSRRCKEEEEESKRHKL